MQPINVETDHLQSELQFGTGQSESLGVQVNNVTEAPIEIPNTSKSVLLPSACKEKKKKIGTEIDPSMLRRSTRANKYDGFKAPSMTEGRICKSKVKPRLVPAAPNLPNTTSAASNAVPPATPISELQLIGTTRCGIPAEDLSPAKLLAKEGVPSSST